jgi:hypothetical protein
VVGQHQTFIIAPNHRPPLDSTFLSQNKGCACVGGTCAFLFHPPSLPHLTCRPLDLISLLSSSFLNPLYPKLYITRQLTYAPFIPPSSAPPIQFRIIETQTISFTHPPTATHTQQTASKPSWIGDDGCERTRWVKMGQLPGYRKPR